MDRRRFYSSKTPLTESLSNNKSLFEETFHELNKLYEANEEAENSTSETNGENAKEQEAQETDKASNNVNKLAAIADKVEIPEKSIKLTGNADRLYDLMIQLLQKSTLPDAVKMLEIISKDDKLKLLLQHGFAGGSDEDEKLKVEMSDASIPVKSLMPTQSEIGVSNSLDNLVKGTFSMGKDKDGNEKTGTVNYADYFKSPALKAAGPVFVYKGTGGYYIIDGHHRWSQIYCMNPEASAYCKVITTNKALNDEQILKNFQAAIAADPNRAGLGRKAAGFTNLFGADEGVLKETVKNMSEDVANKIAEVVPSDKLDAALSTVQIENGTDAQKKAQAYLVSNAKIVAAVKRPSDRKRILMPQTDKNTFDLIDGALVGI